MSQTNDITALATRPVGRLLWHYSLPAVVGMLVMALYNVVDRVFIGQVVGTDGIIGLTVTFPVMNITTAIGVLVGVGTCARISILMGRGDIFRAGRYLGNAVTLTLVNAAIYITLLAIFLDPLLTAFGADSTSLPYARSYMLYVMPGLLLTNVAFGLNNVLRCTGYPRRAMTTMLLGAIVNILLDALFVLVFKWGIVGAAVATDLSMLVSAIFVIRHFMRKDVNLGFTRGTFGLDLRIVADIFALGSPQAFVNAAACLINVIINRSLLEHGGGIAIGAAGIFVTYASLLTTILIGINMGLQSILGYNYGAGLYSRLRRAMGIATMAATALCFVGSVVALTCAHTIARAFTADPYLIDVTVNCLHRTLWAFVIVGFPIVATNFFQSIGKAGHALFLSMARQVIFLIPLMLWLPSIYGVNGVWLSFPLSDIGAFIAASLMIAWQFKALPRVDQRTTDPETTPDLCPDQTRVSVAEEA